MHHYSSHWRRMGLVVTPPESHAWWVSHAGIPTCLPLGEGIWRTWFAGANILGQRGILRADIDPENGMRILSVRDCPGLERGTPPAFDSAGLWPCSVLHVDGSILLWYTGMRLGREVPYQNTIGLAISDDGGANFQKAGHLSIMPPGQGERHFSSTPFVERNTEGFTMWYSECTRWEHVAGRLDPFYDIRVAHSPDGIRWTPRNQPVVSLLDGPWAGLARPWVDRTREPRLWWSARGATFRAPSEHAYRLYSAPLCGLDIKRDAIEPVAFTPPPHAEEWDSWMQCYCCILPYKNRRIMLYSGNDFGRQGFGYALEERDDDHGSEMHEH